MSKKTKIPLKGISKNSPLCGSSHALFFYYDEHCVENFPFPFFIFRPMSQASFFDCEYQLDKINPINDFLRCLDELIDWSIFLDLLTQARPSEKKSNAADVDAKMITDYEVTSASVHDTDEQKASNKLKSKIRCRIEHIFGAQKMRMGNEILRTIGMIRAKFQIGMRNLVYNRSRLVSLKRMKKIK
jgi:hypothetical protein